MQKLELRNRTVLITGASRGLGKQFALHLAREEGANLALVGRNRAGLEEVAAEIGQHCSREVKIIVQDLLADGGARIVYEQVRDLDLFGLVNNAGMTYYGNTEASRIERFRSIIELDFRVVVELSLLCLSRFKERGEGFILNVTSLASFVPIPYQSVYAATKSAAQSFSDALALENRGSRIVVSTFAPAGIFTDIIKEAGLTRHMQRHRFFYLTPQRAAALAVEALKRGRRTIIPGVVNKLIYLLSRLLPRALVVVLSERVFRYDKYRLPGSGEA